MPKSEADKLLEDALGVFSQLVKWDPQSEEFMNQTTIRERIRAHLACTPGCPGWTIELGENSYMAITRCDACGIFETEEKALGAALHDLKRIYELNQSKGYPIAKPA